MERSEVSRLRAVNIFQKIDFNRTNEFQSIVNLAAEICEKPVAILTLLDQNYNWFKVKTGIDIEKMERQTSFCQHAIKSVDLTVIPDATKDVRVKDNPLVTGNLSLRFYASSPLVASEGEAVGTLCLFDSKPGALTEDQKELLEILSRQVIYLIEMEAYEIQIREQIEHTDRQNKSLQQIAFIQSHELRHPLSMIMSLVELGKKRTMILDDKWLTMLSNASLLLDNRIMAIVGETAKEKNIKVERFNKMVHEIEDYAILLLDETGTIENWNTGAELLKGYREDEIVGNNFSIFYTADDIASGKPENIILRAREFGKAKDIGWRVRKDGSKFWASVIISAIHDDAGEIIGYTKVTKLLGEGSKPI